MVTANGQLAPVKNVTVGTQVSGIVKEVLVDFNAQVTNGK
jgi:HlyD family secretion protein